jgi:hypothetical protein
VVVFSRCRGTLHPRPCALDAPADQDAARSESLSVGAERLTPLDNDEHMFCISA